VAAAGHVYAENAGFAPGRNQQAEKHGNGRGFPGAIAADQSADMTLSHAEADISHRFMTIKRFTEMLR